MNSQDSPQLLLEQAHQYATQFLSQGTVATYIPELGKANPNHLGGCLLMADGTMAVCGDADKLFTIQSIGKILSYMFALQRFGIQAVLDKVGLEPTGDPFSSFLKLETASERPFNPLINAGAIVITDFITAAWAFDDLMAFVRTLAGDERIHINQAVYRSERSSGTRNRSLAYLLSSKGLLSGSVDDCLDDYFRICSIEMNTRHLARIGLVLACGGVEPTSGQQLIDPEIAKIAKTLMLTCGMYDGSGEFAVRVGIPSKSGVGGGILSTVGDRCGIGVFGPSLDRKGNSIGGGLILEQLSKRMDLHLFSARKAFSAPPLREKD
jgi:glutaminase